MAANSWEKNLGSKRFWMKIRGAKWGTNFICKEFSWRKFWGACFGGADSFGEEILPAKFLENFLRGKKRILGSKNVLEERYRGQKFLRANCYLLWFLHRTNLNTSVRKMLDVSDEPFSTLV